MLYISVVDEIKSLETMPVLKTVYYPWTDDSYRPFMWCRCASVLGRGMMFDLTSFERDPAFGAESILDDSCVGLTFDFSRETCREALTVVFNSRGRCGIYVGGRVIDDLEIVPECYAGEDERGWYWGVRFFITNELLLRFFGVFDVESGCILRGNIYKFKRFGEDAHIGSVAPMKSNFIFGRDNLAQFSAVAY
ncbi:MAG: hypothetical protein RR058_00085 [Oscillospiraceae bacterium]